MKATDLLKKQHREIEGLFGRLLKSEDTARRKALASEISSMLEIHMTIEETLFYPAYREAAGSKKGNSRVLEANEEHHIVDLLLAELPRVDLSAERFEAKMKVFRALIGHHLEEEEHEMFPDAELTLGRARLEDLGGKMEERAAHLAQ